MAQPKAKPTFTMPSTAFLFKTGRTPGWPVQTGQIWELGGEPKSVGQVQKSLDCVFNCTCTSRPITASYFVDTVGPDMGRILNHLPKLFKKILVGPIGGEALRLLQITPSALKNFSGIEGADLLQRLHEEPAHGFAGANSVMYIPIMDIGDGFYNFALPARFLPDLSKGGLRVRLARLRVPFRKGPHPLAAQVFDANQEDLFPGRVPHHTARRKIGFGL